MVSRCLFMTSSYSSRCLRVSKLRPSTDFCAAAIRFETIFDSMATPFSMPRRCMSALTLSPAKMRIRSSSSERKNRDDFLVFRLNDALGPREVLLPLRLGRFVGIDLFFLQELARHKVGIAAEQD